MFEAPCFMQEKCTSCDCLSTRWKHSEELRYLFEYHQLYLVTVSDGKNIKNAKMPENLVNSLKNRPN